MSAFEAVGYAKFTGKVGVCMATSGPGAIHLLNGLYDARLDHVPVVAIVGQTSRSAVGGAYQQEVDQASLFKDGCHQFVEMAMVPEQFPDLVDRAIRIAMTTRSPTCVIVPSDLQEMEWSAPQHAFKQVPSSLGMARPRIMPDDAAVQAPADILNAGQKVAILIGQGARGAAREVTEVADRLGAGVAKALLGRDVLPDNLPFVTGSIGLLGTRPSYDMMMGCDTLLTVGSSFPYAQFMPNLDQARAVQVDIDGAFVGLRYPYEVNIVADAQATLDALIPLLQTKPDRSWRTTTEQNVSRWWEIMDRQAMLESRETDMVNPMRVVHELPQRIPTDAIVTSGSASAAWYARHLKFWGDMRGSLSGNLATMGPGVPYAIGAKFGHPGRPVVALVGDGAMQMNGLAELITIHRYWREWADPRFVVCIFHNNDLTLLGSLCEFLPQYANSVTLADERDGHGLPVANFSSSECHNGKLQQKAAQAVMEDILRAAGAQDNAGAPRRATRRAAPLGEPRPVHGSHPGAAE